MRTYVCDWCGCPKKNGERWILGFAAERVSAGGTTREIRIISRWSDSAAEHRLAVHFCSYEHKNAYIAALFQGAPGTKSRKKRSKGLQSEGRTRTYMSTAIAARSIPKAVAEPRVSSRAKPVRAAGEAAQFTQTDRICSHGLGIRL
jgi:hypothetical protein